MKMDASHTVLYVFCILLSHERILGQKSGPYNIILTRIDICDDEGTGEIHIGTKMSSKGNNIYTYTNNATFKVPLDERTKYHLEVQQLKNGAYVPKFITKTFKNCDQLMKIMGPIVTDFLKAANYTVTGCPIPAAIYEVRDWIVHIEFSNVPTLFYNSYKMINTFYRDNKKVGCFIMYGDSVPKES